MAGPVGNNPGVQPQQPGLLQRAGSAIRSGLSAIGNKLAQFGHAVADVFRTIGNAISGARNTAHPAGASAPVLRGATFSAQEKADHLQQARGSAFFQALAGSGDAHINQDGFDAIAADILDTPRSVAGMKEYGVTLGEAVAISMYTSQSYREINAALRENTGDPAMYGVAAAFTSALAKLPSFDGNAVMTPAGERYECYRGAKLPRAAGEMYMQNAVVADPGIMSSTYSKDEEFPGCNYSITLLLKPGSEGKDISMFSDKPTECEVAFPPNIGFQVTARVFETDGMLPPEREATYHPEIQGAMVMGTVELVLEEQ